MYPRASTAMSSWRSDSFHARWANSVSCSLVSVIGSSFSLSTLIPVSPARITKSRRSLYRSARLRTSSLTSKSNQSDWRYLSAMLIGYARASPRTRGRCTATLRPPSTTSLGTVAARDAARAG